MPYVIGHSFLPETLELAEQYKLIAINESKYYEYFQSYLKTSSNFLTNNLQHYIDVTKSEYMQLLREVNQEDKRYFASLVRALIYEHYFEELVKPNTGKDIKYFLNKIYILTKVNKPIPTCLEEFQEEINQHIDNAAQHFRTVENQMNTLTKYQNETVKEVKLIHGKPAEDYTESELVVLIRQTKEKQRDIHDLVDTSSRMKEKYEKYEQDIKVYVEVLDALK